MQSQCHPSTLLPDISLAAAFPTATKTLNSGKSTKLDAQASLPRRSAESLNASPGSEESCGSKALQRVGRRMSNMHRNSNNCNTSLRITGTTVSSATPRSWSCETLKPSLLAARQTSFRASAQPLRGRRLAKRKCCANLGAAPKCAGDSCRRLRVRVACRAPPCHRPSQRAHRTGVVGINSRCSARACWLSLSDCPTTSRACRALSASPTEGTLN